MEHLRSPARRPPAGRATRSSEDATRPYQISVMRECVCLRAVAASTIVRVECRTRRWTRSAFALFVCLAWVLVGLGSASGISRLHNALGALFECRWCEPCINRSPSLNTRLVVQLISICPRTSGLALFDLVRLVVLLACARFSVVSQDSHDSNELGLPHPV